MKLFGKFIKIIFTILYWWFWEIPFRFNIFAMAFYLGVIYLCFGSIYVSEIQDFIKLHELSEFWVAGVPFAFPMFLSLAATVMGEGGGSVDTRNIDKVIEFRNGQMNISGAKKSAEILEKTAHLDVIRANQDNSVFKRAAQGFDAKYGVSNPSTIYKKIIKNS